MVRCKFQCTNILPVQDVNGKEEGKRIYLAPVTCGSEENKQFFAYTPYGTVDFGTVNAEAAKQFEVGKEYYVDFTEVK